MCVAFVVHVGWGIRVVDVKEISLDAAALLAPAAGAGEASLEQPTAAREVVPDRDLLGLEHRFEILRVVGRDPEDNRRRLGPLVSSRTLGPRGFGSPRHRPTMPVALLKFEAAVRAEGTAGEG